MIDMERGDTVGKCQTANQTARIRIPANTNRFLLSVFLTPGGSKPT